LIIHLPILDRYLLKPSFRKSTHESDASLLDAIPENMIDENVKLSDSLVEVAKHMRFIPALCDELLENEDVAAPGNRLSGAIRSTEYGI